MLNIDDLDQTGASRSKRSEGQKLRWAREHAMMNNGGERGGDNVRANVLSNILSQMYFVKWEDSELRDVWGVVTTLKRLGASI